MNKEQVSKDKVREAAEFYKDINQQKYADAREIIESLCYQFGYQTYKNGVPCLGSAGLSALEDAFVILGWENPHPVPEMACELCGKKWATCGTSAPKPKYDPKTGMTESYTKNYYRCCGDCFTKLRN